MLPKFYPLKRLIVLRRLSTAAEERLPAWVSGNHTYKKHPRLRSLERCKSLRHLHPIVAFTLVSGLFRNPFVASRVLHSAASAAPPNLAFAALVFSQIEQPTLFCWNTLIRAVDSSDPNPSSSALYLFVEMLHRGTHPDNFTLPFLLKSCRSAPDLDLGRRVHAHALMLGFLADPFVHTSLVSMYLNCGSVGDALRVFDEMYYRDVVSWTAVISGLVDQGCHEQALEVFNDMRSDYLYLGVEPNVVTVVSAMSACAGLGSLNHAKSLHAYLAKVGLEGDVFVQNSLIDVYGKCGSITCAAQVFHGMSERDLYSWTAMIMSLAWHGLGEEALHVFRRMQRIGVKPDSITFLAVLSVCTHAGLMAEGIRIFDSMEKVYGITPVDKHYGCMVDLFSRAGLLARAYEFILSMPVEPNLVILGSLLSACRLHNNLELGEVIAKKIELVCLYQGGAPVILSNMYADQNQWHEVVSIREATRGQGIKPHGRSWIEVGGVIHEFVVDDRSHPLAREMHLVLNGLGKLMEGILEPLGSLPSYWNP